MPAWMLSRTSPMPSADAFRCDIFCNVIDNFGDIGVCWRLARQLATEHGLSVRLWVDDLAAFSRLCPELDVRSAAQIHQGIEIRHWGNNFHDVIPGDWVIEAFACHLPEIYIENMARQDRPPVWVNLDYLSAESWVSGCHALPSPHPRLPLNKYFFFPGFDETTGGLLRESRLLEDRDQFLSSESEQAAFWSRLGIPRPSVGTLKVSLFSYENLALPGVLNALARHPTPVCCFAPLTRTQADLENFLGHPIRIGDVVQRDQLEIRVLPFVTQPDYDRLLWACDLNFVRGEDSFVRAQWAAKPMLWQIYPQGEEAHRVKLDAFLDRYLAELSGALAERLRGLFLAWNGFGNFSSPPFGELLSLLDDFREHAGKWEKNLSKQQDLCTSLVRFCKSKL